MLEAERPALAGTQLADSSSSTPAMQAAGGVMNTVGLGSANNAVPFSPAEMSCDGDLDRDCHCPICGVELGEHAAVSTIRHFAEKHAAECGGALFHVRCDTFSEALVVLRARAALHHTAFVKEGGSYLRSGNQACQAFGCERCAACRVVGARTVSRATLSSIVMSWGIQTACMCLPLTCSRVASTCVPLMQAWHSF